MSAQLVARPAPPSEPEKQTQKAIQKRIVDPAAPYVKLLQSRSVLHSQRSAPWLQPTMAGSLELLPPLAYRMCPVSSITSKYVHTCQNRTRCAVNCLNWTPEGRRCMTGDNIGQLTLWNSVDFKFEQLFQAHDKGLRAVKFSHNGSFLFTCDDTGVVRIFKSNLAPLSRIAAHQEACRAVAIAPGDVKFATCSDDQSVKVWDLATCEAEKTLTGHGSDVRFVDWHPSSSLLASSGRDGLVKLWDAREDPASAGDGCLMFCMVGQTQPLTKVEAAHEGPVLGVGFHPNGHMLATCSMEACTKMWVRPKPGDPWRDAKQGEQDEASAYSELLASAATAGAAAGQQGAAAGAGGAAAAPGQLPGGISVKLPGGIPGLGVPGLLPAAAGMLPMGMAGMGIPGMPGGAAGRGVAGMGMPHMAAAGRGMQHAGLALFVHRHFLSSNRQLGTPARLRPGARSKPPKLKRRPKQQQAEPQEAAVDADAERLDASGLAHDRLLEWFTEDEVEALHQAQANPAALMSLLCGNRFANMEGDEASSQWSEEDEGSQQGLRNELAADLAASMEPPFPDWEPDLGDWDLDAPDFDPGYDPGFDFDPGLDYDEFGINFDEELCRAALAAMAPAAVQPPAAMQA
ncbi:WD40-repeat-containing domain protein [Scenedesmus sp. NREL 46B-D3]|nr:WD40-repeat-containing domain protein [Scenedesmus sp. NREL 46B-D3]